MLTKITQRAFSTKNLCILANNRQADLIGAKIISHVKALSDDDINIYGYGG